MNIQSSKCEVQGLNVAGRATIANSRAGTSNSSGGKTVALAIFLFLLALGLFLPAIKHDFVYFDDRSYVTENERVQEGLNWENIRWAFEGIHVWFYHPVTLLSHMLDCQLYGLKPWGHHLSSMLLHASNALLIFLLFKKMTGAMWRSFFVAALFAVHPLRIESVAWVAERKDVLSVFFGLLATIFYVRHVEGKARKTRASILDFAAAFIFFALGLLSKPMLVTLPFILLLFDFWPLARVSGFVSSASSSEPSKFWNLLFEKTLFLIGAAVISAITTTAQKNAGALFPIAELPFSVRIENALISYCRYLGYFFVPTNLAVLYPYQADWPRWQIFASAALLLAISVWTVLRLRQQRWLFVGWFWFIGALFPVIGLMQAGDQAMADRFTYFPLIGLFIVSVWGVTELTTRLGQKRIAPGVMGALAISVCVVLAHRQLAYWKNSETLFRHAIAVTKDNFVMHKNLAIWLAKNPGRLSESILEFEEVLRLKPDATTHNHLGTALAEAGRLDEAIAHYEAALRLKADYAPAHNHLGIALAESSRFEDAIVHFKEALRFEADAPTHNNLGAAYARVGKVNEAIVEYEAALQLDPNLKSATQALEHLRTEQR